MAKVIKKFDDLHLGLLVFLLIVVGFIGLTILPFSPQLAQTMLIALLFLLAIGAALLDYRSDPPE